MCLKTLTQQLMHIGFFLPHNNKKQKTPAKQISRKQYYDVI